METEGAGAVLIIGAGPAGLAVSKCLNNLHIAYDLVDRHGDPGGAFLRMPVRMQLSSPPTYLSLPGAKPPQSEHYLKADEYARYLKQYAAENGIRPIRSEVRRVEPQRSGFLVTFSSDIGPTVYKSVVVCTGSFENPNVPVIPGLNDAASTIEKRIPFSHACHWEGPASYNSGRLLIIGGGMTAIELAEECVQSGVKPTMSFKAGRARTFPAHILGLDPRFIVYPLMRRAPLRIFRRQCVEGWTYRGINRGFSDYCKRQLIDIRSRIHTVRGRFVTFTDGSSAEIDHIVFATGYRWDMPFLPDLIPKGLQGNPLLKHGQIVDYPGLFCVGITCAFSASSHFIHGISEDSRSIAKAIAKRFAV